MYEMINVVIGATVGLGLGFFLVIGLLDIIEESHRRRRVRYKFLKHNRMR